MRRAAGQNGGELVGRETRVADEESAARVVLAEHELVQIDELERTGRVRRTPADVDARLLAHLQLAECAQEEQRLALAHAQQRVCGERRLELRLVLLTTS